MLRDACLTSLLLQCCGSVHLYITHHFKPVSSFIPFLGCIGIFWLNILSLALRPQGTILLFTGSHCIYTFPDPPIFMAYVKSGS